MKTFTDYGIDVPTTGSGEVDALCPECSPHRKKKTARCLSVNLDKQTFFCHHCGWSGGLAQGERERSQQQQWTKREYRKPQPTSQGLPENVVKWFASRGVPQDVLERNKIGYGRVYMPQVEDYVNAVLFGYYRDTELINIKHRDGCKNFRMEAGAERILYGLNDIAETTIIVEGEVDKLSVEVAGFRACVSVPDGAPAPETRDYSSKFSFLEADKARVEGVKQWVLAVDNDAPGQRLEDELARRLGREKCKRVTWPSGCKDANEVLVMHGFDMLKACIEQAKPLPINGVFEILDLSERIDHLYEHGWEKGLSTGWWDLDKRYTVRAGEFTVVTGMPGSGKSNFIDALAVNLAKQQGWNIAFFSPENQPLEDHMARIIEKWTEFPFDAGPSQRLNRESLTIAKREVGEHCFWVLPDDDTDWTIDALLEAARALVFRKGIRGLVIDPWNELEHVRPEGMTETEYVSRTLKRVRQFARKYGVHIWFVAHPAKLYKDKDGKYPVPSLYDISGSAHWRNKADNGLVVWREFTDPPTPEVDIHVQKVRFRQVGRVGMATLSYRHSTGTYGPIPQGQDWHERAGA